MKKNGRRTAVARHVLAMATYLLLVLAFTWPLPAHLGDAFTGRVDGDAGLYVWNVWVFSHEALDTGQMPLHTNTIFSLDRPADLSLHNYTVLADLAALPLIPLVGVVAAFNLIYLGIVIGTAYATFLLAWHLCRHPIVAWLAGALLACSPMVVARGTGHYSLVNIAPLSIFALLMLRTGETGNWRYAAGAGVAVAAAAYADPYYAVYCLILGALYVFSRTVRVVVVGRAASRPVHLAGRGIEVLGAGLLALIAWIALSGVHAVTLAGVTVHLQTLYTPVLMLTCVVAMRLALAWSVRPAWRRPVAIGAGVRSIVVTGVFAATLLSPLLLALAIRLLEGRYVAAPVNWRSSMPGVDLLALVVPNPSHPLFGDVWRQWLAGRPSGFAENAASVPFTALAVLLFAARRRLRLPRFWVVATVFFTLLALGPFVRVGGVDTCVPTPWTLLRYVPVIGAARAPTRFMALVMVGLAVLFASALAQVLASVATRRRRSLLLGGVAVVLLFELLPAPRTLYPADVPSIYAQIAADPRPVRVLELPTGIRDGLTSVGDFSPAAQFYQTMHHKRLIGGYLSRVPASRTVTFRTDPIRAALLALGEGQALPPGRDAALRGMADEFVQRARLGYVVVDRSRATPSLESFAVRLFRLEELGRSGMRVLYRPRVMVVARASSSEAKE